MNENLSTATPNYNEPEPHIGSFKFISAVKRRRGAAIHPLLTAY